MFENELFEMPFKVKILTNKNYDNDGFGSE